jgi:two-component system KDP operon response regulator KdpE
MERSLLIIGSEPRTSPGLEGIDRLAFQVTRAATLPAAIPTILGGPPDVILLVAGAANVDEQCAVLRAMTVRPLVVVESGTHLPPALAAACFDAGADAVIQEPFTTEQVCHQILAVLRRVDHQPDGNDGKRLTVGDLTIDRDAHSVTWGSKEIQLSPIEFKLLAALAEFPGRPVTTRELLERIWGPAYTDDVHYVRLYISYLRNKLEVDPRRPRLLVNQWGVGYRLAVTDDCHTNARPALS